MLILAQRSPADTSPTLTETGWPIVRTLSKVGRTLHAYAAEYKRAQDAAAEAERLSHALDKAAELTKDRYNSR